MEVPDLQITFQTLRHRATLFRLQILLLMFPRFCGRFLLSVPPNLLNHLYISSVPTLIFMAFHVGFFYFIITFHFMLAHKEKCILLEYTCHSKDYSSPGG